MKKLGLSILSALMLVAFQNCSRDIVTYTNMSNVKGNAMDPNKLRIGSAVWPRTDSLATNHVPLSVTQAALPLAIDFSANPLYDDSSSVTWGFWIRSWKQLPQDYVTYLGQPKYSYRLDLFKGEVIELYTQNIVYELSAVESQTLTSIIQSSILANARQFAATSACTPTAAQEYATLETDYGMFDLGAGSPCAIVDLFRNDGSGQTAGLQDFLTQVQSRIPAVSP